MEGNTDQGENVSPSRIKQVIFDFQSVGIDEIFSVGEIDEIDTIHHIPVPEFDPGHTHDNPEPNEPEIPDGELPEPTEEWDEEGNGGQDSQGEPQDHDSQIHGDGNNTTIDAYIYSWDQYGAGWHGIDLDANDGRGAIAGNDVTEQWMKEHPLPVFEDHSWGYGGIIDKPPPYFLGSY